MADDVMSGGNVWVAAARPRTLMLALATVGMGVFLAWSRGEGRPLIALLCILTAMGLQILSNFANDYGDTLHGADSATRVGPRRAVQSGVITAVQMRQAMVVAGVISAVLGVSLVILALGTEALGALILFALLGAGAIWAAVAYTASDKPYGYVGLGDLFVFIFFGWVAVLGTYYLQALHLDWTLMLPATSCGLFSVAVLNVNNIRDIESDKVAGKRSIPVRIGVERARQYHWGLLIIGFLAAFLYVLLHYNSPVQFLFVLTAPLLYKHGMAVWRGRTAKELDPLLKQMSITTFLFVLTFGVGIVVGG
ncbi:MAG TPA: 1,4-dihydroxy-2-naphthoate polyprenyltransferase [Anaerolineae bacterium]|nr:1,4-dihydroxy-2-naphthoate polyprenyltransferase [Anaerolineae bacterium]